MKKWAKIIVAVALALMVAACNVVSEKPVDSKYVASHEVPVYSMQYVYSFWSNQWVLVNVPNGTRTAPEEFWLKYEATWDDGEKTYNWKQVSKAEYEAFTNGG